MPAAPASVRDAHHRRRLQARLLCAGRAAVDDRELLELLLSGRRLSGGPGELADNLLETFGTAHRVLAAHPDRLRAMPGFSEDAVAIIKAAEKLGIRMAREDVPATVRHSFGNYDKVIEYSRTLAGHRKIEEFHLLYLDCENRLVVEKLHQHGSVNHTPVYPANKINQYLSC